MNKTFLFWLLSVFGFPLGGFAAVNLASTNQGPLAAAIAGFVAGFVIGLGQWIAARPVLSIKWAYLTSIGLAVGALVASLVTQSKTDITSLVIFGVVSGAFVGLAQAFNFGPSRGLFWAFATTAFWGLAWVITANVIVDSERGYVVFGLSGAIVYTIATGLMLRKYSIKEIN